jgi:hypothetical protein
MFTPFAFIKSAAAAGPPAFEFLLDIQSAFVAYSTSRKLSSTYTGSAFRARKNSDGSQQDIGFVDNLVDTASLATFLAGTDGGIVTWYDQSGNGADLGGAGGNLPQIKSGGSLITQAGYQAVTTNGASEYFARTTAFTSNKIVEIMCLGSLTARPLNNGLWWCNPDNGYSLGSYETSTNAVSTVDSAGTRLGQQTVTFGQAYLIDQFDNVGGGTNASFLNISGTQTDYTLTNSSWVATSFNKINLGRGPFGASFYEQTKMNEWVMFGDATSNRTALKANINSFYGL